MYRQRDRNGEYEQGSPLPTRLKPIFAAKRRRQLHPFFFHMGPVALSMCSVLLISLMAILFLAQQGQAVTANQQIQDLRQQQRTLERQDQNLIGVIAQEQSPGYIASHARSLGLIPADTKDVKVILVPHIKAIPNEESGYQP